MKKQITIILIMLLLALAGTAVAKTTDTYYWLVTTGDDAYILCDGGQFIVTVNGADTLYLRCAPESVQEEIK